MVKQLDQLLGVTGSAGQIINQQSVPNPAWGSHFFMSGRPWFKNLTFDTAAGTFAANKCEQRVTFPRVAKMIRVTNQGAVGLRAAFASTTTNTLVSGSFSEEIGISGSKEYNVAATDIWVFLTTAPSLNVTGSACVYAELVDTISGTIYITGSGITSV